MSTSFWPRPALRLPVFAASLAGGWMLGLQFPKTRQPSLSGVSMSHPSPPPANAPREDVLLDPADPTVLQWVNRVKAAKVADFPSLFQEMDTVFPGITEDRRAARGFIVVSWINADADAFLAYTNALPERDREDMQRASMLELVDASPEKAAALLFSPFATRMRDLAKERALESLAAAAPRLYLRGNPAGLLVDSMDFGWTTAVLTLRLEDPAAATRAWSEAARPDSRTTFQLATALASQDPEAAGRWAQSIPEGKARGLALHGWLSGLARQDVRAALREISSGRWDRELMTAELPSVAPEASSHITDYRSAGEEKKPCLGSAGREITARLADLGPEEALTGARELELHLKIPPAPGQSP